MEAAGSLELCRIGLFNLARRTPARFFSTSVLFLYRLTIRGDVCHISYCVLHNNSKCLFILHVTQKGMFRNYSIYRRFGILSLSSRYNPYFFDARTEFTNIYHILVNRQSLLSFRETSPLIPGNFMRIAYLRIAIYGVFGCPVAKEWNQMGPFIKKRAYTPHCNLDRHHSFCGCNPRIHWRGAGNGNWSKYL